MMASRVLLLLQLLLLTSLVSASHHWGGAMNFAYKGRNPDGTYKLSLRIKSTYDACYYYHYWYCYDGNCGYANTRTTNQIDTSTNAPIYESQWCETETIETWNLPTDKPLKLRSASCCWISTRNSVSNWNFDSLVDFGARSDTRQPNKSPQTAIVPFLRVPQNCPRTYKLAAFDPDGDRVRCRYGNLQGYECDNCHLPSGFQLDQDSCTLHYQQTNYDYSVFGFEMVVEDYPRTTIDLFYSDGSSARKYPLLSRSKRQASVNFTTPSWWWWTTTAPPTTTAQPNPWWWWSTTAPPTTTAQPNPWWWWWSTTAPPTTTAQPNPWWWWTTTAPPTTTAQPNPWWWWWSTTAPPTTTAQPNPWWWWTTTAPPSTTAQPNPWWWWSTTTTPAPRTTVSRSTHNVIDTPLSKQPLQFSFLVDPPVSSCQEGLFLPQLVAPTPADGSRIMAEVNKEVAIRVKAQAMHSTIQDIIFSGPSNVTKHRDINNHFVIRWTPVEDDLGDQYPICFAVESVSGSSYFQSEMRCVLVEIRKKQIEATVTCTESTMKVEVEKASFFGLQEDHLRLSDPSNTICSLDRLSNSTHIVAIIPLNGCGTQIEEDEDNLIFKNEITTTDDAPNTLITRKHLLEARFYCQYPKRGNVTVSFSAHRKNITVWEKGFGTFTYQFEFYQDDQFGAMFDPNSYPLEFDIGNRIYMQIDASSSVNDTVMFVESCRAAPYDNPNYQPTYSIIENGCEVDPTVQIHPTPNDRQFRFSMEAFKFIGLHDQVYISCTVMMCEAGNPNTRCSQGCINSPWSNNLGRRKREATVESGKHLISQGPLRLRRAADPRGGSAFNLNLNLVLVAGCLLLAVGMVCGVIIYRTKTSRAKYQPLRSYEN
ncbi:uncharacterized protein LOC124867300 [Girardinichthys multiradiatus]|uniref:uncharacterized protein LOC124867300 n=1 Tax=Girardinichthys multiradiatus TaxID=208333 RepID=UPI001FAB5974|nr:uncharacterized protein LOC124867300 [Girardinichthys multiradiatus]